MVERSTLTMHQGPNWIKKRKWTEHWRPLLSASWLFMKFTFGSIVYFVSVRSQVTDKSLADGIVNQNLS